MAFYSLHMFSLEGYSNDIIDRRRYMFAYKSDTSNLSQDAIFA